MPPHSLFKTANSTDADLHIALSQLLFRNCETTYRLRQLVNTYLPVASHGCLGDKVLNANVAQ